MPRPLLPAPMLSPPGRPVTYLLLRKPSARSASSPSTSSWLSTVPGSFHGAGFSGLSGAGKSQRKASRKPGISSAGWLLCWGASEAMPRASRGGGWGCLSAGIPMVFALRRDVRVRRHRGDRCAHPTVRSAWCLHLEASRSKCHTKPGASKRKGRATGIT